MSRNLGLEGRTVFVTGAGGFIGSAVVRALVARGATVRALVGPPGQQVQELPPEVEPVFADVEDQLTLRDLAADAAVVIHLAGPPSVAASFQAPVEYARVHTGGTLAVLEASRAARIARFVYVSSAEVYGNPLSNPVAEDHPLQPRSPYGASKAAAEQFVIAYGQAYGIQTVIVRPFSVYGPGLRATSVIGTILRQALCAGEIVLGSLKPVRDYCFVDDVAAGIVWSATLSCRTPTTFNLGTGIGTSVGELADQVLKLVGRRLPVRQDAARTRRREVDLHQLIADPRRAKSLGWTSSVSVQSGLEHTLHWMAGHS